MADNVAEKGKRKALSKSEKEKISRLIENGKTDAEIIDEFAHASKSSLKLLREEVAREMKENPLLMVKINSIAAIAMLEKEIIELRRKIDDKVLEKELELKQKQIENLRLNTL